MYLFEIIAISSDYDGLKHNAQIAKPIQYDVRHIKRTYGNFGLFIDTILGLEKALLLIPGGVERQIPRQVIPD